MSETSSHRQILRSTSIIGGASVINILVGLLRTKVAALLLGPAGIGLIGLFQSLMSTASTVSSLGFGTAGIRQIAEAIGHDDPEAVKAAREALFWGTLALAIASVIVVWVLRDVLATQILRDARLADAVGWLGVGVALTVASGSQSALLNGMRRVGDIGRVSIISALLTTILGIASLFLWGTHGVVAFVIATPLASFLIGHFYVARLPKVDGSSTPIPQLISQWRILVRLGTSLMVAGLITATGHLAVRALVQHELGPQALGYFQASWAVSMTYIGFVLHSMGADYYPRLTAAIHDHATANRMANEQTEVALLLAGPVFLAMLGLAPILIGLLYSGQFSVAAEILRWQLLGDLLKVVSWPLGFIILASGDGRAFMVTESLAIIVFVYVTWVGLPLIGINATGIAYLSMYIAYLPAVYVLARQRTGFRWNSANIRTLAILKTAVLIVFLVSYSSPEIGSVLGAAVATAFSINSFNRLKHIAGFSNADRSIARTSHSVASNRPTESTPNISPDS